MLSISSSASESNHDQQYYVKLDGSANGIQTNFPLHGTQVNFSASAWVTFDASTNRGPFVTGDDGCMIMGFSGDNGALLYNSGSIAFLSFPSTWDNGDFHFMSVYFDKDNITNVHVFFDGSEISKTVISNNGAVRDDDVNHLEISSGMNGKIGFTGVHSGEITLAQHTELYNRGRNYDWRFNSGNYNIASNLQGFWMMGQGKGDTTTSETNSEGQAAKVIGVIQDQTDISAPNLNYTNLVHNGTFATGTTLGQTGSGYVIEVVSSNAGGDDDSAMLYDNGGLKFDKNSQTDVTGVIFKDASGNNIMPGANLMYRIKYDITQVATGISSLAPERFTGHGQADEGGQATLMDSTSTGTKIHHYINRGTELGIWTSVGVPGVYEVSIDNVEVAIVNNGKCAKIFGGTTIKST
tara:strand:+ start:562 stop:1788 length:1227 start_codon:yes stop_codon:yes gene_type:complete